MGMWCSTLNPNFSAWSRMALSPSSSPSSAIGMLQLRRTASAMLTVAPGPQVPPPELITMESLPGSWNVAGLGKVLSGVYLPDIECGRGDDELEGRPGRVQVAAP